MDFNAPKNNEYLTCTFLRLIQTCTGYGKMMSSKKKLTDLILVFIEKIIDHGNSFHLKLFFGEKWESLSEIVPYRPRH